MPPQQTPPSLLILAAGMGSRYGGLKQMAPIGPQGETILDYTLYDAFQSGFEKIVFVIRKDFEISFREKILAKFLKSKKNIQCVFQEQDDLPPSFSSPPERAKPWGTAHAIRAARHVIKEPFGVMNADDFYGRPAIQQLFAQLTSQPSAKLSLIAYPLQNTLSPHGTVSRGICSVNKNQQLEKITEATKLEALSSNIINHADGKKYPANTPVSMNLWGFSPEIFPALESQFAQFLSQNITDSRAEFGIPDAVQQLMIEQKLPCQVLHTDSPWFGITYAEDRPKAMQTIQDLIAKKTYPSPLFS